MKKVWTIALTLAVCAALILTREKQPQLRTASVSVRDLSRRIEVVGTVEPVQTCALMADAAGKITSVFVQEGERVGRGQAVAEIELMPEYAMEYMAKMQNAEPDEIAVQERLRKICTITAPQEGILMQITLYEGMQTAPGSALGYVLSDEVHITTLVPESQREELYCGQMAAIRRGEVQISGSITYIAPSTEMPGQYLVTILPCERHSLQAGMQVDVEIEVEECSAPSVPLQALRTDGTVLCRMEQGTAAVPVRTGLCTEGYAQLLSGPPLGTEVVIGEAD